MHVTVGGISCKFAQPQSERGAQDDKVNTPTQETLIRPSRHMRIRRRSRCRRTIKTGSIHSDPLSLKPFMRQSRLHIFAFDDETPAMALRVSTMQSTQSASSP